MGPKDGIIKGMSVTEGQLERYVGSAGQRRFEGFLRLEGR